MANHASPDRKASDIDDLGRPSLYYPYIHIRSEHWLKATLLCAPTVKRMVPESYTPEDLPNITKYTRIEGPGGALLQEVPSFSEAVYRDQQRLLRKLVNHGEEIQRSYDRKHAPTVDEYWIHAAKFIEPLLDHLIEHGLAWHSYHSNAYGHRTWYALHPTLGSAIMTTLGLSIAHQYQYDIVTPSQEFHETLLATKEREIFETLLAPEEPGRTVTVAQTSHDLSQLVIALTGLNLEALRPEDIPELQASKHLRAFRRLIRTRSHFIDREADPRQYRMDVKDEADEIIQAWHEAKTDLASRGKGVLFDAASELPSELLKQAFKGPNIAEIAISGGLGLFRQITKALSRRTGPYQYLTQIVGAQDQFLRMSFPLGIER